MNQLVLVVPLKPGALTRARELVAQGPPFDPAEAALVRHDVYATESEIVFVFESAAGTPLRLSGEDPSLWRAAAEWRPLLAGRPRKAATLFSWERGAGADRGS